MAKAFILLCLFTLSSLTKVFAQDEAPPLHELSIPSTEHPLGADQSEGSSEGVAPEETLETGINAEVSAPFFHAFVSSSTVLDTETGQLSQENEQGVGLNASVALKIPALDFGFEVSGTLDLTKTTTVEANGTVEQGYSVRGGGGYEASIGSLTTGSTMYVETELSNGQTDLVTEEYRGASDEEGGKLGLFGISMGPSVLQKTTSTERLFDGFMQDESTPSNSDPVDYERVDPVDYERVDPVDYEPSDYEPSDYEDPTYDSDVPALPAW